MDGCLKSSDLEEGRILRSDMDHKTTLSLEVCGSETCLIETMMDLKQCLQIPFSFSFYFCVYVYIDIYTYVSLSLSLSDLCEVDWLEPGPSCSNLS